MSISLSIISVPSDVRSISGMVIEGNGVDVFMVCSRFVRRPDTMSGENGEVFCGDDRIWPFRSRQDSAFWAVACDLRTTGDSYNRKRC